jgi:uncharacterized membrane protein YkvI
VVAAVELSPLYRLGQWCCAITLLLCILVTTARADTDAVKRFLEVNGCVIGPSTLALAVAQKIDQQAFENYATAMRAQPGNVTTGQ